MASGKQAGVVMKPVTQQLRAHIHKQEAESTLAEACAFFIFHYFLFILLFIIENRFFLYNVVY